MIARRTDAVGEFHDVAGRRWRAAQPECRQAPPRVASARHRVGVVASGSRLVRHQVVTAISPRSDAMHAGASCGRCGGCQLRAGPRAGGASAPSVLGAVAATSAARGRRNRRMNQLSRISAKMAVRAMPSRVLVPQQHGFDLSIGGQLHVARENARRERGWRLKHHGDGCRLIRTCDDGVAHALARQDLHPAGRGGDRAQNLFARAFVQAVEIARERRQFSFRQIARQHVEVVALQ